MSLPSDPQPAARSVAEGMLLGITLGVVLGVLWWQLTPSISWQLGEQGVFPAEIGHDDWFAADGWFLVLGLLLGGLLAVLVWRRVRPRAMVAVAATLVGAGLLAVTGWALGGVLGPDDPATLAGPDRAGEVVEGALGIGAPAVLLAPLVGGLAVLGVRLATLDVVPDAPPVPTPWPPVSG